MATSTPNFSIPLYSGTDNAKLDTLLNGQANAVDANLKSYLDTTIALGIGTNADRIAVTSPRLRDGYMFYCTDTKIAWQYAGASSSWVPVSSPWTAFAPTWSTPNLAPSIGNGSLTGEYRYCGQNTIALRYFLTFGSSTSGGSGAWSFSLPSGMTAASPGEHALITKAYLAGPGQIYVGVGTVAPGGAAVSPNLPVSSSASNLAPAQNANSGGGGGTGVPLVSGQYSYASSSNLLIRGEVKLA